MKGNNLFNKILIVLIVCSIFLTPVFATDKTLDYVFKQYNNSEIQRPCYNTGTNGYCSPGAICAISVYDPDNVAIVFGRNMTNQIYTQNYTLPVLNKSGIYKADIGCAEPDNTTGYESFFFGVNQAGSDYNTSNGPYFILGIVILLLIAFALASYFLEDALKLVFLVMSFIMLSITLWVSLDIARNTFISNAIINVLSTGFTVSLVCFGGIVLYVLITLLTQLKIRKTISIQKQPGNPAYWQRRQESKKRRQGEEYQ